MITKTLVIFKHLVTKYSYIIIEINNFKLSMVTNKAIDRILVTNYTKTTSNKGRLLEPTMAKISKRLIIKTYN